MPDEDIEKIKKAPKMEFKEFEDTPFFEGCMPIEEIIKRGDETLRYGPMKPIGLTTVSYTHLTLPTKA